jgi:hypothetical protein
VAHARIRSIRLKNGGAEIRVIRRPDVRSLAKKSALACIDALQGDVAGMAIVVWAADGGSTAAMRVGTASTIPSILVGDFVRNRLLAEVVSDWTLDVMAPPKPEGS